VMRTGAVLQAEDQNWTTGVIGTSPDYLRIRNWHVARGRAIDRGDVDGLARALRRDQIVDEELGRQPGGAGHAEGGEIGGPAQAVDAACGVALGRCWRRDRQRREGEEEWGTQSPIISPYE